MKFWQDAQTRGMVSIVIAMSLFSVQDVTIKWLSGDYPLHEVIAVRATIAACVLSVLVLIEAGWRGFRTSYPAIHAMRGMLVMIANSAYFLALAVLPLAEVLAIFYVAPLLITALSAIFLKDQVGIRRWSAVCVGIRRWRRRTNRWAPRHHRSGERSRFLSSCLHPSPTHGQGGWNLRCACVRTDTSNAFTHTNPCSPGPQATSFKRRA